MSGKKISDNKSFAKISKQIQSMHTLITIGGYLPKFMTNKMDIPKLKIQLEEISKSSNVLLGSLDKFNEYFAEYGWIAYESLNINTITKAILIFENDGIEKAEDFLANSYDENTLKFGLMRFHGHKVLSKRIRLLELAKEDYLFERYHACIPLTLSLIDGIVNDISNHVGFFAEQSNLIIDDTISGHETGLHTLRKLLSKGKNKTNEEPVFIPFRNGILHGRELAFDNKIVASKCWNTLFAISDWTREFTNKDNVKEADKPLTFTEIVNKLAENERLTKRIDDWKPRDVKTLSYIPYSYALKNVLLPINTPERGVAEFLDYWIKGQWGLLAEEILYFSEQPKGKKIKRAKEDFGVKKLENFHILNVEDEAPAISNIIANLKFEEMERMEVKIRCCYQDSNFQPLLRDEENGKWKIVQNSFSNILYG